MKYLANSPRTLLGTCLLSVALVAGCGSRSGEQKIALAGTGGAPGKAMATSTPTLSPAQQVARKKAAAQAKQRAEAQRMRAAMAIPGWARGKVLRHVPVKAGNKVFALTFDDGPWPRSTRQILRILKQHDAKATFYVVGQEVRARPKIAREIYEAGHALGNHSWSHPSRPRSPISEVTRTNAEVKRAVGVEPTSFRPPYGILARMAHEAQREGQPVLLWSADSHDWRQPGASRIASRILSQASPGGVALLHDGGGHRNQTVAALPVILRGLQARGYKLVTIPELLRHRYVAPKTSRAKKSAKKTASKHG